MVSDHCEDQTRPTKTDSERSLWIATTKKFICEKIEMEVSDDGISKVKTGYFYEIVK